MHDKYFVAEQFRDTDARPERKKIGGDHAVIDTTPIRSYGRRIIALLNEGGIGSSCHPHGMNDFQDRGRRATDDRCTCRNNQTSQALADVVSSG